MKINMDGLKDRCSAVKLWGINNAPTILTVVGSISVVVGTVMACVKTANVAEITEERNSKLDILDQDKEDGYLDEKEYGHKVRNCYFSWALAMGRNYAIPATIEIFGLFCIGKGHGMMLGRCATLGTLLNEAITKNAEFEERVRAEIGDEAFNRLKMGEPTAVTTAEPGKEPVTTYEFDPETEDFDFVWTEGMGEYSVNDHNFNMKCLRDYVLYARYAQQRYKSYCPVNDIYRMFGAYNKIRTEYDTENMGFPNLKLAPNYECKIELIPIEGTTRKDKRCPDYHVHFIRKPICCRELNVEAGFRAS